MVRLLNDLASIRFNAEWHSIPASAIGAPHHRDRIFIIATNTSNTRCNSSIFKKGVTDIPNLGNNNKPSYKTNRSSFWHEGKKEVQRWMSNNKSIISGMDDGISGWVDRGKGLGNAIVPQVAAVIMQAIKEIDEQEAIK